MMHTFLFHIFYSAIKVFSLLPLRAQYIISDISFVLMYYIIGYRKKVVMSNLQNSFPEKTTRELKKIARGFYFHLADSFIESTAQVSFTKKEILKRFRYRNPEVFQKYFDQGKSIILVMAHYSNWEWSSGMPLATGHKVLAAYKPINNNAIDKLFIKIRSKFGVEPVPMLHVMKHMLHYQRRENTPTVTMLIADQRPIRRNVRYWTTFLNQETPVLLGPEKFGIKTNNAVIYLKVEKIRRGYYEADLVELFEHPKDTTEYQITEKHLRELEKQIRIKPEYWLWSHRRWRHDRQKVEEWQRKVREEHRDKTIQKENE